MNNIVLEKVWTQNSPIVVDNLIGTTVTGESEAHTFKVRGVDAAQEPVAITGTITGKLLNANNDTVPLTGSLSNGIASVTLTETCYAVPGRFIISIFATNGDVTQCLYCGVGNVFRASSSTIAYPTDSLPDITSLMADLEDILDGWPADYSAIQSAVTTIQSQIGNTPMGTNATTITGAIAEHEGDIGDLKSDVGNLTNLHTNDKSSLVNAVNEVDDKLANGIEAAVENWLDDHPEATTTVQDGSLTEAKFSDALKLKAIKDYVTPEMYGAKGDGITDDSAAFAQLNGKTAFLGAKTYIVENLVYNSGTYLVGAGVGKTILKLKDNATTKIVLSMVNADHSHIEAITLDGNKTNNSGTYDTYDGVLVLKTNSSQIDYLNASTFENIEIKNGGNIGLCLPYVSGITNYNWCYICSKFKIMNCDVGMYNMSSDNTFADFNITNNVSADLICYKSGSNKYSNFKLDGESGRTKTANDVPSGASLIFYQASNEEFTNLDVQSAYYHGIKVIYSHNISLLGDINNCGMAYTNEEITNMDGIGISFYGSRDCKASLNFNIPNLPLQRTNVTINSSSHRISIEYIADMATYSQYPAKYISQSTDSSIVRKDYSADIATVIVTLSSSSGWSSFVDYPAGFARSNCIGILTILNDTWRNGADVNGNANYRFFSSCETEGVRVYNNVSTYYGAKAAVTLVRIAYSTS